MIDPRDVKTATDAKQIIQERKLNHLKVGVFDIDGVMRGKYMSREKFLSALDKGFGFCDVVLGWDSNDQLYDSSVTYTGWNTGYPDAPVRIIPDSCRSIPFESDTLLFIAEFTDAAEAICPRALLRRLIAKADTMGFDVKAAAEYEFFLFDETPDSIREKGYRNLKPITPGFFGYSMLRNSVHSNMYQDILNMCREMDFDLEGLHTETGPGVLEGAITVDDMLNAADKAALFKTYMKIFAQRNNMMATFMAKWSPDWPGQSGHLHLSLWDKQSSKSAFFHPTADHNMSDIQRYFVGGLQKLMPEFCAMIAQTVNSYSRLIPGFWAPTHATWDIENRTTSLRVIPGSENSQRVEHRLGSADANPYIAFASVLGAGLWGIENKIEPGPATKGNAYEHQEKRSEPLPATLFDAAQQLKESEPAKQLFGEAFVNHYSATRQWEEREFRKHITDWEMERYFEII